LRCLRENLQWKRPELWHHHKWLLHYNNAPAHCPWRPLSLWLTTIWLLQETIF
jgi:hypothetical protein